MPFLEEKKLLYSLSGGALKEMITPSFIVLGPKNCDVGVQIVIVKADTVAKLQREPTYYFYCRYGKALIVPILFNLNHDTCVVGKPL